MAEGLYCAAENPIRNRKFCMRGIDNGRSLKALGEYPRPIIGYVLKYFFLMYYERVGDSKKMENQSFPGCRFDRQSFVGNNYQNFYFVMIVI